MIRHIFVRIRFRTQRHRQPPVDIGTGFSHVSYWLRQLPPLVRCLSEDAVKTLIQAFINTRLDYCNSLYFGIADGLMSRLQSVQNAAARLVTGVRRCEHITPVLHQLHWLPVRRRVEFKISTFVYRSLAVTAPVYLADECTLVTDAGRRPLQSADSRTCVIKRSRNQFGDRCFATTCPTLWNSLPVQFRQPDITFRQFKRLLKTFMFG